MAQFQPLSTLRNKIKPFNLSLNFNKTIMHASLPHNNAQQARWQTFPHFRFLEFDW